MTVTTTVQKVQASGNGSAFVFSFSPVVITQASDLVVTKTTVAGAETTLVQGTDYALNVTAYPGTGSITYLPGTRLATGETLTMRRVLPLLQETALNNQGGYFADVQEATFDYGRMVDQQLQEQIDRSLKFPAADGINAPDLPTKTLRASKLLGFDSDGLPTPVSGTAPTGDVSLAVATASGGTAARSLSVHFGDVFNVKDFGAKGDNSTDDTAAIQAAINATSATFGGTVYIPAGYYIVSATLTIANPGVRILGAGRYSVRLSVSSHTFNVFEVSGVLAEICSLGIVAFGTTSTQKWAVKNIAQAYRLTIRDVYLDGLHSCFYSTGALFRADNVQGFNLRPTGGRAVWIEQDLITSGEQSDVVDCWFENAAGSNANAGLLVTHGSSICVINSQFIKMGNPIWASPGSGQTVFSLQLINSWSDTSSGIGLALDGSNGIITRVTAVGCWMSSCNYGVQVKGTVYGLKLHGCQIFGNTLDGIQVLSTDARGLIVEGCQIAGNGSAGVDIQPGVSGFSIVNNAVGPATDFGANGTGVAVATGASDDYIITGNRLRGNTGTAFSDGGTGTTKIVTGNLT